MKKYSAEFFKRKFEILFNKLLIKEGFINEIKESRKELGIPPEKGFASSSELGEYLLKKLTKSEKEKAILLGFINRFEIENHIQISEKDREKFFEYFIKNKKGRNDSVVIITYFQEIIEDHNNLFTSNTPLRETKFFSKLSPIVFKIFNKYWGFDLLDEWITIHLVEKYLFLGKDGVDQYIREKIDCTNCRYIGVDHFSPTRLDMQGILTNSYQKYEKGKRTRILPRERTCRCSAGVPYDHLPLHQGKENKGLQNRQGISDWRKGVPELFTQSRDKIICTKTRNKPKSNTSFTPESPRRVKTDRCSPLMTR